MFTISTAEINPPPLVTQIMVDASTFTDIN